MRYAPNDRPAFKHKKRRPAMKKISTVQVFDEVVTALNTIETMRSNAIEH
jgi:hypothetical protein